MKSHRPPDSNAGSPLKIVLAYGLVGALWILFSDLLMAKLVPDRFMETVSIAKGWFFIGVTALMLHILIKRRLCRMANIIAEARAQEAVHASEMRFKDLLESVNLVAVLLDLNGKVSYCNRFLLNLTGFRGEELLGSDWFDLMIPDAHPEVKELFLRGLRSGEIVSHVENPVVTADGSLSHIAWNNTVLRDAAGIVMGTASIGEDITEQKAAKEKTEQNLKEMTSLHSLSRQIAADISVERVVDVSLAGLTEIIHPDLILFFMRNGEKLELFRSGPVCSSFRLEEIPVHSVGDCLCGMAISSATPVYSLDIHADSRCTWTECKRAGLTSFAALPLLNGDGVFGVIGIASATVVDYEKQRSFLEAYAGEVALGLKNAQLIETVMNHASELEKEVGERKKAEEEMRLHQEQLEELVKERTWELATANERLMEIDRLKSLFIASMSHELRTPLNSVIGFSSILLNGWIGDLNDEQKKSLNSILRSGKHLLELINDVIDVSKIEAGMIDVSRDEFNLADLLVEVEQNFAGEAKEQGLFLSMQSLDLEMLTDRRRLLQCLLNLVSNAIKFTEKGGVKLLLSTDEEKSVVTISVTDTGIGIGASDLPRLFQPFSRIQSSISSKVLGTGLGLYLTRKIVMEILQGDINVISEFGVGSNFRIAIPCRVKG